MKLNNIKYIAVTVITALTMSSCDDFLDRPTEDSYNTATEKIKQYDCDTFAEYAQNNYRSEVR